MIRYYLNGIECNPANKDDVEYVFDFSQRQERKLELSVDSLVFVREDYESIKTWWATYGRFVGMPLDIQYSNGLTINYMLDFSDPSFKKSIRSCTVKIKKLNGIDNFFDNADGLSFGIINWLPSDFVFVDYVVIPDNQFAMFMSLSLATFALSKELATSIYEVGQGIADVVKAAIPVGLPIPGPDWGAIAVAVIKLAIRIAYTIFLVIALIKVVTELLNLIFPLIRQFKAVTVRTLIQKSAAHLGFTLQSTLLDSLPHLTICPVPLRAKNPTMFKELFQPMSLAYTKGYPSSRDTIQTLGQLINAVEATFNAKTQINNNVLRIEQEMVFEQGAVENMPIAFNIQERLENESTGNSDEIFKRLVAFYAVDPLDINTYDDSARTLYELSSEISTSPNILLNLIKNVDQINIPFARGTRKSELTFLEKAAKVLAIAVDAFTGGGLVAKINNRKDVLQISNQYFGVTKLLYMNGTKLNVNQNAFIGCDVLVQNYHYSRFITNNQKDIYAPMDLAQTESEIFNKLSNNFVILNNGLIAEIKRIQWSERTHMAKVDYSVRRPSVNEINVIIDAG